MSTAHYWEDAIKHLSKNDKKLKNIISSYKGEKLVTRGSAFHTLARSIVGQQISVKAADSVWGRVMKASKAKGGNLNVAAVERLTDEELRACGLSGSKVKYLRSLCEFFKEEVELHLLDDEAAIKALSGIHGIGRWSAEMFLIFHLLRPDVLPLGDIGLQKAMFKHYFDGEKVSKAELEAHAENWRPYRSVATWYLWRSLDPVPVEY